MQPNILTELELTDNSIKYGQVTVYNRDGSINREFKISPEEELKCRLSPDSPPIGVTKDEWANNFTSMTARSLLYKQAFVTKEGELAVNYGLGSDRLGAKMDIAVKILPKEQFLVSGTDIYLTQEALDTLTGVNRK
jgi:hypothetical protein